MAKERTDSPNKTEMKETETQNKPNHKSIGGISASTQYANEISQWIWQYYHWVGFWHWHQYASAYSSYQQHSHSTSSSTWPPNSNIPRANAGASLSPPTNAATPVNVRFLGLITTGRNNGSIHTYRVPPLWKRFAAEAIDFLLLFVIKLGATLMTVDYLGILDLDKYDLNIVFEDMKLETLLEMTTELMILEVVHRMCVIIFETIYIAKTGATPGKRALDLKVVACESVQPLTESRVLVIPSLPVTPWKAFLRATVKNLLIAFLFPACATSFVFRHGRAFYDFVASTIVVEDDAGRNRNENVVR